MTEPRPFKGICLGVPIYGFVSSASFSSFITAIALLSKLADFFSVSTHVKTYVHLARRHIAEGILESAKKNEIDYAFWIDGDSVFSEKEIVSLLQAAKQNGLDIVSGLYVYRMDDSKPIAYVKRGSEWITPSKLPKESLVQVNSVGFGFTLVKVSVIQKLVEKYGLEKTFNVVDLDGKDVGEDFLFCQLAEKEGFKVWVHTGVKVGHDNSIHYPSPKIFEPK
ncbi:MAG: glycosyltransferase [Candidatus Diapherotrites archaeon]